MPEEYGKVALFSSVVGALAVFLNFTESAKSRFGREELDIEKTFQRTFWGTILIKFPVLILIFVLSIVYKQQLLAYLGMGDSVMLMVYIVILLSVFGGNTELLVAQEKFKLISLFSLTSVLIRLTTIALLILDLVEPVAFFLVLMFVLQIFLKDVMVNFSSYKLMGRPRFDFEWIRSMFVFSLPFVLHFLSEKTVEYIDTIVIRKYLPFAEVGIYSVAYKVFMFAIVPSELIRVMIKPRMISLYLEKKMDVIRWFYKEVIIQVNFFFTQLFSFSIIILPLLVYFVGEKYMDALDPLAILLSSFAWLPLIHFTTPLFHASKRVMPHIAGNIASAFSNLLFDFILIPIVGIIGGAIATTSSLFICMFIHLYFINRFFKINIFKALLHSIPLLILVPVFVSNLPHYYTLITYILITIIMWTVAIKTGMFKRESFRFYEKLGFPKKLMKVFEVIYMKILVK